MSTQNFKEESKALVVVWIGSGSDMRIITQNWRDWGVRIFGWMYQPSSGKKTKTHNGLINMLNI